MSYELPPDPTNAVLKRVYPWDEYDKSLVLNWLYNQAQTTGFAGTFEDFKQRYGAIIDSSDPQDVYDLIDNYAGKYNIIPLEGIEQRLNTKNKVLNKDIVIAPIPEELICNHREYNGEYEVTPLATLAQILRTKDRILEKLLGKI